MIGGELPTNRKWDEQPWWFLYGIFVGAMNVHFFYGELTQLNDPWVVHHQVLGGFYHLVYGTLSQGQGIPIN